MYKKLITVVEAKAILETKFKKKKTEFENANSVLIAQLEDLKEKEVLLREEAILNLEKEEKTSVEVGGKVIYSQMRVTKSIGSAVELIKSFEDKQVELKGYGVDYDMNNIFDMEPIVTNKKLVLDIAKKYNELTGKELEGIGVKQTKFLTIKNKE